jgi:hypothetical protein
LIFPLLQRIYTEIEIFRFVVGGVVKEGSKRETEKLGNNNANLLETLKQDLLYIEQMEFYEQKTLRFLETGEPLPKSPLSEIVPISGLILGKFHRIENELKTVLEHWRKRKDIRTEKK